MDWKKITEYFTREKLAKYLEESKTEVDKELFLGKKLFPLKPVDSPEVEIESTKTPIKTKILIPSKEIKDHLKVDSINYLTMSAESEKAREAIAERVAKGVSSLNKMLELHSEKEIWDMLTLGTVQILKNKTPAVILIPFKSLDITRIADGICYHTATNWFNANGLVNPDATILNDIKEWQVNRGGPEFTRMIMNSTTFEALRSNIELNTVKSTYFSSSQLLRLYNMDLIRYDATWDNNGTPTKYLPDYYVIFLPESVGVRYIAPNSFNNQKARYARSWHSEDPLGFWYEVGERSFPLTNTLKTHGVMYVKAAE